MSPYFFTRGASDYIRSAPFSLLATRWLESMEFPMKLSRVAAGGISLALVIASLFVGASAASADDVTLPSPLPGQVNPYANTWFAGIVPGGDGTLIQSPLGLKITGGTNGYRLLNGFPSSAPAGGLASAMASASINDIGTDAVFQIAVFGESATNGEFTILSPALPNDPNANWISSESVAGLTADTPYSQATIAANLDGGASLAQVLAFGVFVNAGDISTIVSLTWILETYNFADAPSVTVSPATVTSAQLVTPGVTITASAINSFSGTVFVRVTSPTGQVEDLGEFEVDADGSAVINIAWGLGAPPEGTYTIDVSWPSSYRSEASLAAAVTVADKTLAASGVNSTGILLVGGALLLGGAGAALFTVRRKSA